MGDRISISFKNGADESVALFSHWDGQGLLKTVKDYFEWLSARIRGSGYPIDRLEPETVIVDFIRYLTKDEEIIKSNYYLGKDENSGDNGDNGHFTFDLQKGDFEY